MLHRRRRLAIPEKRASIAPPACVYFTAPRQRLGEPPFVFVPDNAPTYQLRHVVDHLSRAPPRFRDFLRVGGGTIGILSLSDLITDRLRETLQPRLLLTGCPGSTALWFVDQALGEFR